MIQKASDAMDEVGKKPWWKFNTSTWLLIGGLVLFNIGCFVSPWIVDSIFLTLDFRLWPWWYFIVLLVIVAFSAKWFLIAKAWYQDDLDEMDMDMAKKFLRMSILITSELVLLVLLHATSVLNIFYWSLWRWFRTGTYSHLGTTSFLLIVIAVGITIYFVKEWLAVALRPED